ncbi:MAG: hypothetical protein IJX25_03890 [Clostridia bacterium]|nr:hypothetical protein [Clostridia bacterium]MBQ8792660.1 hypothetical protein [Clostridia bacterium]
MNNNEKEGVSYPFANGLVAKASYEEGDKISFKIYSKGGRLFANTNMFPVNSYKDSGYFPCSVNGGKNVRFMDGNGLFCFGIYGKRTRGFVNHRALIERRDGTLTFLTDKGKELSINLKWASDFSYLDNKAQVIFAGDEDNEKFFIDKSGVITTPPEDEQDKDIIL